MTAPSGDALSRQMEEVRRQLAKAEQTVEADDVVGTAGDNAVRIKVRGEFSFTSVEIDPRIVDPAETALLEDLVLVAVRDAASRLAARRRAALGAAMGGILGGLLAGEDGDPEDAGPSPTAE